MELDRTASEDQVDTECPSLPLTELRQDKLGRWMKQAEGRIYLVIFLHNVKTDLHWGCTSLLPTAQYENTLSPAPFSIWCFQIFLSLLIW